MSINSKAFLGTVYRGSIIRMQIERKSIEIFGLNMSEFLRAIAEAIGSR